MRPGATPFLRPKNSIASRASAQPTTNVPRAMACSPLNDFCIDSVLRLWAGFGRLPKIQRPMSGYHHFRSGTVAVKEAHGLAHLPTLRVQISQEVPHLAEIPGWYGACHH